MLPHPSADFQPGIALTFAERRKTRETDPELVRARSCRLVVFGIETGGRWSQETASFIRLLAHQGPEDPVPGAAGERLAQRRGLA